MHACRGSPLSDFVSGLAGGKLVSKEISYEVWFPTLRLPVFVFIWKFREIKGAFPMCFFPLIWLKKKKKVFMKGVVRKEVWGRTKLADHRGIWASLLLSRLVSILQREGLYWSLTGAQSLVLPSLISEQEKGGAGWMLLLWLSLNSFPNGMGWASPRQESIKYV